jgi:hypothetical protein
LESVSQLRVELPSTPTRQNGEEQFGAHRGGAEKENAGPNTAKDETDDSCRDSYAGNEENEVSLPHLQPSLFQRLPASEGRISTDLLIQV